MNTNVTPTGTPAPLSVLFPNDQPLNRPLTVTDRDNLIGYLRLIQSLIPGTDGETARRMLTGTIKALENR